MLRLAPRGEIAHPLYICIAAVLLLSATAVYVWQITRTRDPAVLTYCLKYAPLKPTEDPRRVQPMSSCVQTKTLKVPAAYYGVWDSGPGTLSPEYANLEVAYPSMKPWVEEPWLEQSRSQKIKIRLGRIGTQSVRDSFKQYFWGTPKPRHVPEPLFGLDRFDLPQGWYTMFLIPLEAEPRVHFGCGGAVWAADKAPTGLCDSQTQTNWELQITYSSPKSLLPQWPDVHAKIISLVDSFVVNP